MRGTQAAALSGFILSTLAHPHALDPSANNLQARQLSGSIERFRPVSRSTYNRGDEPLEGIGDIGRGSGEGSSGGDCVAIATDLLRQVHPEATFRQVPDNWVSSSGVCHIYFKQTLNGIDIDDGNFNVNVLRDGTVLSYGDSFHTGPRPAAPPARTAVIEPQAALETVVEEVDLPLDPAQAEIVEESERSFTVQGLSGVESPPDGKLVYYRNADDELVSAWRIETDLGDHWLTTYLDAENENNVLAVTDYVADAEQYQVFEWPLNDPRGNSRTIEVLPRDERASRLGWHRDSNNEWFETRGNNAIAQPNRDGNANHIDEIRPFSAELDFQAPFDETLQPIDYINASTIQLFYTTNKWQDIMYVLGFTEAAGNFQNDNFGRGGVAGDSIILNTQDGSGTNNANFATPPDGRQGRMRMYEFTQSTPRRDSSFEAGIVVHEGAHGLTNRMTGGPLNSRCLATLESGGMGEGWSDFYATAARVVNSDTRDVDYPIGDYAFNNPRGIRAFVYSTDMATNPYTYSALNTLNRVHQFGTVWCTILYDVLWNLIDVHGNTARQEPELDASGIPTDGKYLAQKLVLDALAFQPCSPTFIQARDAILDADWALTGGENLCSLWTAFAKRGLGEDAARVGGRYTDGFVIPRGIC